MKIFVQCLLCWKNSSVHSSIILSSVLVVNSSLITNPLLLLQVATGVISGLLWSILFMTSKYFPSFSTFVWCRVVFFNILIFFNKPFHFVSHYCHVIKMLNLFCKMLEIFIQIYFFIAFWNWFWCSSTKAINPKVNLFVHNLLFSSFILSQTCSSMFCSLFSLFPSLFSSIIIHW